MSPLLLALLAMLAIVCSDLIAKRSQAQRNEAATFIFWQFPAFVLPLMAAATLNGDWARLSPQVWLYGLSSGAISFWAVLLFVRSLRGGEANVNVPIFRLNFVVTALGGVLLLNETINLPRIGGLLCAVASIWIFREATDSTAPLSRPGRTFVPLLLAMFVFGATGVIVRAGTLAGATAIPLTFTNEVGWVASSLIYTSWIRQLRPDGATLGNALPAGLVNFLGVWLFFEAIQQGEVSLVAPVIQLSFVLTALLAPRFFREEFTQRKALALVAASATVALFALS